MDWTLKSLVAPLSEAAFRELLFYRTLTHLPATHPDRFQTLLNWSDLRSALAEKPSVNGIQVTRKGGDCVPSVFFTNQHGIDVSRLFQLLDTDHSLLVRGFEKRIERMRTLTRSISRQLQEQVSSVVVSTTGPGGAVKVHFDPVDVIVLQLEGSKYWRILANPVINPVPGIAAPDLPPDAPLVFDQPLHSGDVLFLPAGYWHWCENVSPRSLHLAITIKPPCGQNVLAALTASLIDDPAFRRPIGRGDPMQRTADQAAMKATLLDRIAVTPPAKLIRAYLRDDD